MGNIIGGIVGGVASEAKLVGARTLLLRFVLVVAVLIALIVWVDSTPEGALEGYIRILEASKNG